MIRLRYGLLLLLITVAVYVAKSQDSNYYSKAYSFNRHGQYGIAITADNENNLYVSVSNPCDWPDQSAPFTCFGYMKLDNDANIIWVLTSYHSTMVPSSVPMWGVH